jgi:hypothetical protein
MPFLYVATSQKPTSVTLSVECNFTDPSFHNVVVARGNSLEILILKQGALHLLKAVSLFGRIVCIEPYRLPGSSQDLLFILTQKKHYCILEWDNATSSPKSKAAGNLKDRFGKDCDSGYKAFIDPDLRMIGISVYEGQLKVFFSCYE